MKGDIILWTYIVLLVVGGMIGFFKARSSISLITSVVAAAVLTLCATGIVFQRHMVDVVLALLLVLFGWRLTKTRKFMPSGLMLVLTLAALALRHIW